MLAVATTAVVLVWEAAVEWWLPSWDGGLNRAGMWLRGIKADHDRPV